MGQQGIYVAPCNTKPSRDKVDVSCMETVKQKLWIIEFDINRVGKGCSVVKASNAKDAETLLRTQGTFNGVPNVYKITRIEEISMSPDSMLICEQIAVAGEN